MWITSKNVESDTALVDAFGQFFWVVAVQDQMIFTRSWSYGQWWEAITSWTFEQFDNREWRTIKRTGPKDKPVWRG